jgi:hypothetical protein
MEKTAFIRNTFFVLSGLLIWAAYFGFVYVFNALACARGFHRLQLLGFGVVPLTIVLGTALAVAAVLALMFIALRAPGLVDDTRDSSADFLRHLAVTVALLSLLAIGWIGLPAMIVPPCG